MLAEVSGCKPMHRILTDYKTGCHRITSPAALLSLN